jgi:replicative DNA helicase
MTSHPIGEFAAPVADLAKAGVPLAGGLPTGFKDLDQITGGLQAAQLAVIASRPGMGRTTLLSTICHHVAAKAKVSTMVFTLEETAREYTTRMLSSVGRISLYHLRNGQLTDEDKARVERARPILAELPLWICADPMLTMADLAAQAREAVDEHGVEFIAVDGLTDIKPEKRHDLREREVGDIARDLKTLARELAVPVLATTHLNRIPEQRPGHVPKLDDLRESGAVTFAADWIVLLHRPDYYERESPRAGEIDMHVAKNRFGPLGCDTEAVQFHYGRIVEFAL